MLLRAVAVVAAIGAVVAPVPATAARKRVPRKALDKPDSMVNKFARDRERLQEEHAVRQRFSPDELVLLAAQHTEDASVQYEVGRLLQEDGRLADSVVCFQRAIEARPDFAMAHYALTYSMSADGFDPDEVRSRIKQLRRLVNSPSRPDAALVEFALHRSYEMLGEYQNAWEHLVEGNRIQAQLEPFDKIGEARSYATFKTAFGLDQMLVALESLEAKQRAQRANGYPTVIAMVGMPRCGSTLLEQILGTHSAVFAGGESVDFATALGRIIAARPAETMEVLYHADVLAEIEQTYFGEVAKRLQMPNPPRRYFSDKTLSNYESLGLQYLVFPDIKIIHVVRDPLEVILSCFKQKFNVGHTYSYNLDWIVAHYRAYQDMMDHWQRVLPAGTILEVHYENLVKDFRPEVERVLAFLGLEWEDSLVRFYETPRSINTASLIQARRPINATQVGRWSRAYSEFIDPEWVASVRQLE